MIFRNVRKRKKEEAWKIKGKELEVVNEFKYLGYWFTTGNREKKHAKRIMVKAQKAANATWGLMKRTGREQMEDRLYLMNLR